MIPVVIKQIKSPRSGVLKYYYQVAPVSPLTLERIAKNISGRCTVTETDCLAVLNALETEVITALQDGHSVRLGQLGSFRPTVSCQGEAVLDDLTVQSIKAVRARFTMGGRMRSALLTSNQEMKFEVTNSKTAAAGGE